MSNKQFNLGFIFFLYIAVTSQLPDHSPCFMLFEVIGLLEFIASEKRKLTNTLAQSTRSESICLSVGQSERLSFQPLTFVKKKRKKKDFRPESRVADQKVQVILKNVVHARSFRLGVNLILLASGYLLGSDFFFF